MTLKEMSVLYEDSAVRIRLRIKLLQEQERGLTDAEEQRRLEQRIGELLPLLREMRELAVLTACYYDGSYHKNEKYTL